MSGAVPVFDSEQMLDAVFATEFVIVSATDLATGLEIRMSQEQHATQYFVNDFGSESVIETGFDFEPEIEPGSDAVAQR